MAFSIFGIFAVLLEVIRPWLPLIVIVLAINVAVTAWLLASRGRSWTSGGRPALLGGAVIGVLAFFLAPWITSARFSDLSGLLDWLSILGGSIAAALVAAVLLWPLTTALFGKTSHS